MDLVTLAPRATPDERTAVDVVLGAPVGRWDGGEPADAAGGHGADGGHAARDRRHLLLPVLHAIQGRVGWISRPALEYACRRLSIPPADAYGVALFYGLFSTGPRPPIAVHVCDDIACRSAGAEDVCRDLERALGPAGTPALGDEATWLRSPCLGRCERAPAALFTVAGTVPETIAVAPIDAAGIVTRLERTVAGRRLVPPPTDTEPDEERLANVRRSVPQAGQPGLRILRRVGVTDPRSLDDYRAADGYRGLRRAFEIGREAVIGEVTASGLVGRGGAAFPTGRKWAAVAAQSGQPHYTVCNADESEPGTFKDRVLMEEDPYAIVEAMTIEGFATGSTHGFLYIRAEYPLSAARMAHALATARQAGLLGPDILGSGISFDIEVRRGAGAYVCGEETALFNSIEGRRGEPRNKPPFPVESGLFGRPTAVNNIETLVNIPGIVADGGAAFAALGTEASQGAQALLRLGFRRPPGRVRGGVRGVPARAHRACRRCRARPGDPGGPARRGFRRLRRTRRPGHAADVRGDARGRRHARVGRGDGLRRDGGPRRDAAPGRGVLPRRIVRPVRAMPGRDRPPGGAPGPACERATDGQRG